MARPYHTRALLLRFLAAMPDHPDEVARLAVDVQDWRELFGAAALHGVALVLVDALRHAGVTLPAALSRQLDELVAVQSLENELSLRALRNCVDALDKARIQVLPLKGPLLSERVYGSPFARPSIDIDLLVDEHELQEATRALRALDYRTGSADEIRYYRENHHHITLTHDTLPTLELHFSAFAGFGVKVAAAPLLARAREWVSSASGIRTRVLHPEDEFLYLAIHGMSHRFVRLMWLYDLKLFARTHPSLSWDRVRRSAETLELRRAADASMCELERRLGTKMMDAERRRVADPLTLLALPLLGLDATRAGRHSRSADALVNFTCSSLLCDSPRLAFGNIIKKVTKDLPRRLRSANASRPGRRVRHARR